MSTLWLVFAFILPRTTLLLSYLTGNVPPNDTALWVDGLGTVICPRPLIAYWGEGQVSDFVVAMFAIAGVFEVLTVIRNALK